MSDFITGLVERDYVVVRFNAADVGADLDHNTSAFVSQYRRKQTLRVVAGQRKGVSVADAGGLDFDQHFSRFGPVQPHGFDGQRLAGLVGDGGADIHDGAPGGELRAHHFSQRALVQLGGEGPNKNRGAMAPGSWNNINIGGLPE